MTLGPLAAADGPAYASPRRLRLLIIAAGLLVPATCVLGVWCTFPWFRDMHARLEPWKLAGYWAGDTTALLCFLWFAASALAFGVQPLPADVERRLQRSTAVAMAIGLSLDLGFTWYIGRAEDAGYAHGVVTTATVVAVHKADAPYILDCRYTDAAGVDRRANLRVFEGRQAVPSGLHVQRRIDLRSKPLPFRVEVRYDPTWPDRCWVDGAGTANANDLVTMSHILAIFQAILIPILWGSSSRLYPSDPSPVFPAHRLFNAVPLGIEACVLAFFGLLTGLGRLGFGP